MRSSTLKKSWSNSRWRKRVDLLLPLLIESKQGRTITSTTTWAVFKTLKLQTINKIRACSCRIKIRRTYRIRTKACKLVWISKWIGVTPHKDILSPQIPISICIQWIQVSSFIVKMWSAASQTTLEQLMRTLRNIIRIENRQGTQKQACFRISKTKWMVIRIASKSFQKKSKAKAQTLGAIWSQTFPSKYTITIWAAKEGWWLSAKWTPSNKIRNSSSHMIIWGNFSSHKRKKTIATPTIPIIRKVYRTKAFSSSCSKTIWLRRKVK